RGGIPPPRKEGASQRPREYGAVFQRRWPKHDEGGRRVGGLGGVGARSKTDYIEPHSPLEKDLQRLQGGENPLEGRAPGDDGPRVRGVCGRLPRRPEERHLRGGV